GEMIPTFTREHIELRVRSLGDWFHNLDLGGVKTAPNHFLGDCPRTKRDRFAHVVPADLRGKTVLDVGCNAGFYAIEMKRLADDSPFEEAAVCDPPGYPKLQFVERAYTHDPTNWWIPMRACAEAMLRSSGFSIHARAEEEVYLCERAEIPTAAEAPPAIATA